MWLTLPPPPVVSPCTADQLGVALREHRPDLVLVGETDGGAPEVTVSLSVDDGAWMLRARTRTASHPLERQLPPPGADCEVLSQTAALMVARYLEEIQAEAAPVVIAPIVHLPPPPPVPTQMVVELAGGVAPGQLSTLTAQATVSLDVAARRGPWQLGVSGALIPPEANIEIEPSDAAVGTYSLVGGRVEVVGERRLAVGPGTLRLGLAPGVEVLSVSPKSSVDPLFDEKAATGVSALVAARAGYEIALPWRLAIALRAEGRWNLQPADFYVTDTNASEKVQIRTVDGDLDLSLSRVFF